MGSAVHEAQPIQRCLQFVSIFKCWIYRSSTSIHRNESWKKRLQIIFVCKMLHVGRACDRALSRLTISSGCACQGCKARWPSAEIKILNQPTAFATLLSGLPENVRINACLFLVSLENVTRLSNVRCQGYVLWSWGSPALDPQVLAELHCSGGKQGGDDS